jgi:hypothetical protein
MKPLQDHLTTAIHVTTPRAADILGITPETMRSRLRRGKLHRDRGEDDGTVSILWGDCDCCEYMACSRFRFALGHLYRVIGLVTMRVAMGVLEASLKGSAAPGTAAYGTA